MSRHYSFRQCSSKKVTWITPTTVLMFLTSKEVNVFIGRCTPIRSLLAQVLTKLCQVEVSKFGLVKKLNREGVGSSPSLTLSLPPALNSSLPDPFSYYSPRILPPCTSLTLVRCPILIIKQHFTVNIIYIVLEEVNEYKQDITINRDSFSLKQLYFSQNYSMTSD